MWIWDSRTHQFIVQNALKKCDPFFVNLLHLHQELLIFGIEAPDRIFKDTTNHYYNCTPNEYGIHSGSVIKKINEEINQIHLMLKNPDTIFLHPKIAPFLIPILNTPLKAFIFEIGVLTHYIADLHQPLHTDGKYRFPDEITVHKILEADTRLHLKDFSISLHRRLRIKDPLSYFIKQIYIINHTYNAVIDAYYKMPGKVKTDRWRNCSVVIKFCLGKACQNIANVLLDFEAGSRNFKTQLHHEKLLKKIENSIDYKNSYKIVYYPTGTISIRRVKQ